MIRSIERRLRGTGNFIRSNEGMTLTGGIILGAFAFGNMYFSGIGSDVAELVVHKLGGNYSAVRSNIDLESVQSLQLLSTITCLELSAASGILGFLGGEALTRKLMIWKFSR